jgi:hypothetical protein
LVIILNTISLGLGSEFLGFSFLLSFSGNLPILEQTYDIHVARSLCSDAELEGTNMYWQANLMVMIFFLIAVIVLCSMYEMFKNREIAAEREKEAEA